MRILVIVAFFICAQATNRLNAQVVVVQAISDRGFPALQLQNTTSNRTVTAYAFSTRDYTTSPNGKSSLITSERTRDSILLSSVKPIPPGQTATVEVASDNATTYSFKAALFDDGSSFGDADAVNTLIDARRVTFLALKEIIAVLHTAELQNASKEQLKGSLGQADADAQKLLPEDLERARLDAEFRAAAHNVEREPDTAGASREEQERYRQVYVSFLKAREQKIAGSKPPIS